MFVLDFGTGYCVSSFSALATSRASLYVSCVDITTTLASCRFVVAGVTLTTAGKPFRCDTQYFRVLRVFDGFGFMIIVSAQGMCSL